MYQVGAYLLVGTQLTQKMKGPYNIISCYLICGERRSASIGFTLVFIYLPSRYRYCTVFRRQAFAFLLQVSNISSYCIM